MPSGPLKRFSCSGIHGYGAKARKTHFKREFCELRCDSLRVWQIENSSLQKERLKEA